MCPVQKRLQGGSNRALSCHGISLILSESSGEGNEARAHNMVVSHTRYSNNEWWVVARVLSSVHSKTRLKYLHQIKKKESLLFWSEREKSCSGFHATRVFWRDHRSKDAVVYWALSVGKKILKTCMSLVWTREFITHRTKAGDQSPITMSFFSSALFSTSRAWHAAAPETVTRCMQH